jgi:hypothetical protein
MQTSLLKTLANKHKATVMAMVRKHRATKETPHGQRKCLRVIVNRGEEKRPLIAEFGGIPLRHTETAKIDDAPLRFMTDRTDLLTRMLADTCELCGWQGDTQVHHIHKMSNLHKKGQREKPAWVKHMIAIRRKTLVVCRDCHAAIHAGRPTRQKMDQVTGEPDDAKVSSPVRRGADGKGH